MVRCAAGCVVGRLAAWFVPPGLLLAAAGLVLLAAAAALLLAAGSVLVELLLVAAAMIPITTMPTKAPRIDSRIVLARCRRGFCGGIPYARVVPGGHGEPGGCPGGLYRGDSNGGCPPY